jgi:hypothetical protein
MLSRSGEGCAGPQLRSRPDLLAAVNGLFGHILSGGEDFSPAYLPVVPHREDPGTGSPVTLFTLGEEVREADFVCSLVQGIAGLVAVGGKGEAQEHTASFRDIAVLYRSDTGGEVLTAFRESFGRSGVPFVVPPRKGFYPAGGAGLRMVLRHRRPADLSARYAALKTIFFGLRRGNPALHADGGPPFGRASDAAAAHLRKPGRAALSGLLADLYRETGVEFVAARLPDGDRIVQNLAKAAGMARAFEWTGGGSVKAFLADLRRKTEEDRQESEFPSFDEGENAVQISTVHAPGAGVPIVIRQPLAGGRAVEGFGSTGSGGFPVIFPVRNPFRIPSGPSARNRDLRAVGAGEAGRGGSPIAVCRRDPRAGPALRGGWGERAGIGTKGCAPPRPLARNGRR